MSKRSYILISLIAIAIATRIIPHAPNFTAVGAAALLGGVLFKDIYKAILVPVIALFISDLFINNVIYAEYAEGFQWLSSGFAFIYGGFILSVLIARYTAKGFQLLPLAMAGIASTLSFYLITNFGAWLGSPLYPNNFAGLMGAYWAGIPFLAWELLGTFFYGAILFGAARVLLGSTEGVRVNA